MELPEELKIFLVEAFENLETVEQLLLELERTPESIDKLNSVFRAIHTVKGNSGFLGLAKIETLCHRGEAVLDRLRSSRLKLSEPLANVLLTFIDCVRNALLVVERTGADQEVELTSVVSQLEEYLK